MENNNKLNKMQSHKMQTAVANVRAKTKYVFLHRKNNFATVLGCYYHCFVGIFVPHIKLVRGLPCIFPSLYYIQGIPLYPCFGPVNIGNIKDYRGQ